LSLEWFASLWPCRVSVSFIKNRSYLDMCGTVGSGYTVEGQVTGKEKFSGFQIEVTPSYGRRGSTNFWDPSRDLVQEYKTPENLGLVEGSFLLMAPAQKEFRPIKLSDFLRPGEVPASVKLLRLEASATCLWFSSGIGN
jgi:hypothetical protein